MGVAVYFLQRKIHSRVHHYRWLVHMVVKMLGIVTRIKAGCQCTNGASAWIKVRQRK